jgi:hypothetical protein
LDIFLNENKKKLVKKRARKLAIFKKVFFHLIFLFSLITIIFVLYQYNHVVLKVLPEFLRPNDAKIYPEWSFRLESHGTESCIKTYDIDQDGLDDIIFGLASYISNFVILSIDFN